MRRATAILILVLCAAAYGCSLLVDTSNLTGGAGDGGNDAPGDALVDAGADDGRDADVADTALLCDPATLFGPATALSEINTTTLDENYPRLTADELQIFFSRPRPDSGVTDVYVATRPVAAGAFGAPALVRDLGAITSPNEPSPSADGRTLYFGADGTRYAVYAATRPTASGDFSGAAQVAGPVNAVGDNGTPSISADGKTLYFASSRVANVAQIFAALGSGQGSFNQLVQLDDGGSDRPTPSADDRIVYFSSPRASGGALGGDDIWLAHRASSAAPFGAVSNVSELNTTAHERPGWLSPDSCRLYFDSDRSGSWDIYLARRSP